MKTWTCPLCAEDGKIERGSDEFLDMAVASHILQHEQRAALKSVDAARLGCRTVGCEIGKNNKCYTTAGISSLTLTDFDRSLLAGMKISNEG
jgi:hypothetical protein